MEDKFTEVELADLELVLNEKIKDLSIKIFALSHRINPKKRIAKKAKVRYEALLEKVRKI